MKTSRCLLTMSYFNIPIVVSIISAVYILACTVSPEHYPQWFIYWHATPATKNKIDNNMRHTVQLYS